MVNEAIRTIDNTAKRKLLDFLLFPVRFLLSHEKVRALGLTSLLEERVKVCLKESRGKMLDIACGKDGGMASYYGNCVNLDIVSYGGAHIVADAAKLSFRNESFQTVTILTSLQYIADPVAALRETARVLTADGKLLMTMPNPLICFLRLRLMPWVKYEKPPVSGFWANEMKTMIERAGLYLAAKRHFDYGLNTLYVCRKA
ncbi:MAG: methyltransferase domain-containing protein [Candidatus Omnitrophica bacterium]|nr:methyltransferase domain-containing protein [Candidatus Omnitrophota bacterium]